MKILKRRDHIVSKVKSKYWKTNQKFGINLPHFVLQALKLDQENGNNLWFETIKKEMKNVRAAFYIDNAYTCLELFGVKCEKSFYNRDCSGHAISACARMIIGKNNESWKSKKKKWD